MKSRSEPFSMEMKKKQLDFLDQGIAAAVVGTVLRVWFEFSCVRRCIFFFSAKNSRHAEKLEFKELRINQCPDVEDATTFEKQSSF
jgi:hypothetical protein